VNLKLKY